MMWAVNTTGNGGYEKLDYRLVPTPEPSEGEVLVRVLAAGMNNTEINTRLGWYSSSVTGSKNPNKHFAFRRCRGRHNTVVKLFIASIAEGDDGMHLTRDLIGR